MKKIITIIALVFALTLTPFGSCETYKETTELVVYASTAIIDSTTRQNGIDSFCSALKSIYGLTYQIGSRGSGVREIQSMLSHAGYLGEGEADGVYGEKTASAISVFQDAMGLPVTGIASVATQMMLVLVNADIEQQDDVYLATTGKYAFIIWPDDAFYIGSLNNQDTFDTGTYYFTTGDYYSGEFKNKLRNGDGVAHYANGDIYNGQWADDKMEGEGTYYFGGVGSNEYYKGHWKSNAMDGKGKYVLPNGNIISGSWEDNKHVSW